MRDIGCCIYTASELFGGSDGSQKIPWGLLMLLEHQSSILKRIHRLWVSSLVFTVRFWRLPKRIDEWWSSKDDER